MSHAGECTVTGCPLCNPELASLPVHDPVAWSAWLTRRTLERVAHIRGARAWCLRTSISLVNPQEEPPMTHTSKQQEALRTVEDELAQPGGELLVQLALGQLRMASLEAESERTALIFQVACAPSMQDYFTRADLEALDLGTLSRLAEVAKVEFDGFVAARESGVQFCGAPDGYAIAIAHQKLREIRADRR